MKYENVRLTEAVRRIRMIFVVGVIAACVLYGGKYQHLRKILRNSMTHHRAAMVSCLSRRAILQVSCNLADR